MQNEARNLPPWPPVSNSSTTFDIHQYASPIDLFPVSLSIRIFHVALLLILDECISARLPCHCIKNEAHSLDRPKLFEFLLEFDFSSVVAEWDAHKFELDDTVGLELLMQGRGIWRLTRETNRVLYGSPLILVSSLGSNFSEASIIFWR